jgi:uncharacterized protein YneF (UPF0154 family)
MLSQETMYLLLIVLTFIIGVVFGSGLVLWIFAKDKTIAKISDDDVIVKKEELEAIKKKLGRNFDD